MSDTGRGDRAPAEEGPGAPGPAGGREATGRIEIDAPPDRVWEALTDARELERWFPLEARVEPGEGGTIYMSWKNEFAGTSRILAWDPPRHLRTSWDWGGQVTDYLLEADAGGRTVLRVVTSGFPEGASWDDWIEGTRRGWAFELASLKHYLEGHAGEDRSVVYVRRRVGLGAEEAWKRLTSPEGLDERWLGGRRFDDEAPVQVATVLDDPADSILRVSVEPSHEAGDGARDVTLFLATWGDGADPEELGAIRTRWSEMLTRVFPDGRTP